ncbi:hexuronate transporter [Aliidongia dinghuensis]|uniref:Hexuronate transporter n=1 Tax=Aliidongia dinghuensis TaxID=1867774 RepID=A0A8J2YXU6_9PROT|nr:MFS transporter [Aliidongia dinghuensis]GGF37399.1 hexuronate transporter [Aliidongia dinghuensis]
MLTFLFVAGLLNYLDRASLSVLAPLIARDLKLDPAELGIVFSSFAVGYAAFCLVGGWAADKFKPQWVLLACVVVWSVFCGLTAVARTLETLLLVRVLFGMGEGGLGATSTKLIGRWFPRHQQATAISLGATGTSLGAMISGPLVVFIAGMTSWQVAFVAIAALGLLWSVAWAIFNRFPSRWNSTTTPISKTMAPVDEANISSHSTSAVVGLIRRSAMISIAFAFFGYSYLLFFFLTWFPSYLVTAKHMAIQDMSLVSAIPWALGSVGLATGGLLSDKLASRTGDPVFSRKLILVSSLAIAAVGVALAGLVASPAAAIAIMGIAVFFMYLSGSQYFVIVLDLIPAPHVGAVTGFVHFVANCAGILAPLITGFIIRYSGSFDAAFVLAGIVASMGAAGVGFFVKTQRTLR